MVRKYSAERACLYFAFSFSCSALAGFFRNLGALFSRFREADGDCLFSGRHLPALSPLARTQRPSFFAMHRTFHVLAGSLAIFPFRTFFPGHFVPSCKLDRESDQELLACVIYSFVGKYVLETTCSGHAEPGSPIHAFFFMRCSIRCELQAEYGRKIEGLQ